MGIIIFLSMIGTAAGYLTKNNLGRLNWVFFFLTVAAFFTVRYAVSFITSDPGMIDLAAGYCQPVAAGLSMYFIPQAMKG